MEWGAGDGRHKHRGGRIAGADLLQHIQVLVLHDERHRLRRSRPVHLPAELAHRFLQPGDDRGAPFRQADAGEVLGLSVGLGRLDDEDLLALRLLLGGEAEPALLQQ